MREVPCAKCGTDVPLEDYTCEWVVRMNVVLNKRRQPPLRRDEIVLCGNRREGCYREWQAELGRRPPQANIVSPRKPTPKRDPQSEFA